MKKVLIFTLTLWSFTTFCQTGLPEIFFTYDEAGNRIRRVKEVPSNPMKWGGSEGEQKEEIQGSKEISKQNYFSVTPNPSTGNFTITTSESTNNISVVDINGRVILDQNNFTNSNRHPVDISSFPRGIYLVKVIDKEDEAFVERVVYE